METILIVGQDGNPVMINVSDYDASVHVLCEGQTAPLTAAGILDGAAPLTAAGILDGATPLTAAGILDGAAPLTVEQINTTATFTAEQINAGAVVAPVTVTATVVEQEKIVAGAVAPTLLVRPNGKTGKAQRFTIVDEAGNVIQDDFETETAAWDAILKR